MSKKQEAHTIHGWEDVTEILYESKDGIVSIGYYRHDQDRRYNYYWINTTDINDFEKSGQIRLDERQFKLLKKWFKKEKVKR